MDLIEAIKRGDSDGVAAILAASPNEVFRADERGSTPLHQVAALGEDSSSFHVEVAQLLLKAGAEPNARDKLGWTPLHFIAANGSAESIPVARVLLENGADTLAVADDGITNWRLLWQHGNEIHDLLASYEPHNQSSRLMPKRQD